MNRHGSADWAGRVAKLLGVLTVLGPASCSDRGGPVGPPRTVTVAETQEIRPGDTVLVVRDGAALDVEDGPAATLAAGTSLEVDEVDDSWVVVHAAAGGERKRGRVRREDIVLASRMGEWPQFHGPRRDNVSDERGLLRQWPADGPPLDWFVEGIGEGHASVAVAGGRIYTAGNVDGKTMITALDLQGSVLWQQPNGPAWTEDYPGARGTPTVDGDRLYHESPLGQVVCMDAATGQVIWTRNILDHFGSRNIRWGLAESLLVDGDHVIATPGGPETCVVALHKEDGRTVWQSPSADGDWASYASPSLAEVDGVRIIFQMTAKALVGVDAETGALYFRYPHRTQYDINALCPIYHDGRVFISSNYGTGSVQLQLRATGGGVTATRLWEYKPLDNHHGGVLLVDGCLYGSSNRSWHCLDWETGRSRYRERGVGKGSLTYADGMLYTLGENRTMALVAATPERHRVISRFALPEGGEGPSWAHPVVCGGRLYVRHGNFLYAYNVLAER